ncbi:MAG: type I methionyl aminopeptidase [Gemmatimonadota bacterium]|jgi:methionyl aminopeptidase|nr:type I methionyl aminopeptidase [Gemmatimonadota bacterium]
MVQLKSAREIEVMAEGGRILVATLEHATRAVEAGLSTWELDQIVESFIRAHHGAVPAFKGLYGFPGSACISVNHEIVHGIPSRQRILADGDIVTLDIGVKYRNYYTDSARTVPVGRIDAPSARLLEVTQASLEAGVAQCEPGKHLGDIGHAIQAVVEAAGFSVVRELVGHGVGSSLHEEPQVPNYGKPKRGLALVPGMTLAIEPMVNAGRAETKTLADKWTVVTADGSRSAHFEHTVAITEDGPRILTRAA